MSPHPLQCRCGTLKGHVANPQHASRGICYCRDCRAFAHYLGQADAVLDELGGTDVIATMPGNIHFTEGAESLSCMRLTDKGLLRWYASCCNTPIGNTAPDPKMPYIGLVHNCLEQAPIEGSFGPVRMWVNTGSAKGKVEGRPLRLVASLLRFMPRVLAGRFNGKWRLTPFFDVARGAPRVQPKVLSAQEHAALMSRI